MGNSILECGVNNNEDTSYLTNLYTQALTQVCSLHWLVCPTLPFRSQNFNQLRQFTSAIKLGLNLGFASSFEELIHRLT